MMEKTAELYDEIAALKEQLHKHGKAIARIEHWCDSKELSISERATLETVLRIFEWEGVK